MQIISFLVSILVDNIDLFFNCSMAMVVYGREFYHFWIKIFIYFFIWTPVDRKYSPAVRTGSSQNTVSNLEFEPRTIREFQIRPVV